MQEGHNPEPASPSTVTLPAVDGPTVINLLVTHRGWTIVGNNNTHIGLKKPGYLGSLMVPMKKGQALVDEYLRAILKDTGIEPEEFLGLLAPPPTT